MRKSLGLVMFSLITVGCAGKPVDPIAAEMAETAAEVEAMKRHPSVLEHAKKASADPRAAQK